MTWLTWSHDGSVSVPRLPVCDPAYTNDSIDAYPDQLVRAYRRWEVGMFGVLKSYVAPTSWPKPIMQAECHRAEMVRAGLYRGPLIPHDLPAPHQKCSCGLYAAYSPDNYDVQPSGCACRVCQGYAAVTGVVDAYGNMILGPGGLKAEYMRIVALSVFGFAPDPIRKHDIRCEMDRLQDHYQVPVYADRIKMLADYPEPDRSGLNIPKPLPARLVSPRRLFT